MRNKTWLVFRMQFRTLVFNATFLIILISMPLLSVFSVIGIDALNLVDEEKSQVNLGALDSVFSLGATSLPMGFVDQSGIVRQVPDDFKMEVFPDEAEARQALAEGRLAGLYILPSDYLQSGDIRYYELNNQGMAWVTDLTEIEALVNFNLLAGDAGLWERVKEPFPGLQTEYLTRGAQVSFLNLISLLVPVGMAMLFYLTISSVASLLFESLVSETSNQTIEVLMTSVNMRQLLIGKVLALGLVGLMLEISWVGLSALGFSLTGQAQSLNLPVTLTNETFFWGVVFFLLGYAVYAALITSIGALVQRLREQWQVILVVMLPMFIPVLFLLTNTSDLDTPLWIFLSLFPLTSPVGMFSRLILTDVPIWEVLLSIALLIFSSYWILRLAVRLFRGQYLLSPHPWAAVKVLWGRLRARLRV